MVNTLDVAIADSAAPPSPPDDKSNTAPVAVIDDRREWMTALGIGIGAMVVSRLVVLFGVYARAAQVVTDRQARRSFYPSSVRPIMEGVLSQWDGKWYRMIAEDGYPSDLPERITYISGRGASVAFFPVYPYLSRGFDYVFPGSIVHAMLGINVLLSIAAVVLVGLLARQLYDIATAQRAMILFAFFPGSVVLSWTYAEAALIVCAAACLLFLLREQWVLAGIVAAIGTATRPNGIAIVAACAVAAAIAIWRKRQWASLISVALAPLGALGFYLYLRVHPGEPNAWRRAQEQAWNEGWSWGLTARDFTWEFIINPLGSAAGATYMHTALAMVGLAFGVYCSIRKRLPLAMLAYVAVVAGLMIGPDTVSARPRFLFTAFPLAVGIAAWWPRRSRHAWNAMVLLSAGALAAAGMFYGSFSAIP